MVNNYKDVNTIGIIFFKIEKNNIYIYLKKNNTKYEDYMINTIGDLPDISTTPPIYKIYNDNHTIILINIKNHIEFAKKCMNYNNFEIFSFRNFCDKNFHKYLKSNRIKNQEIECVLEKIKFNIMIRTKL
jgi:hypothetical protein